MYVKDIIHRLSRYVNGNVEIREILNLNKGGFCFIVRGNLFADADVDVDAEMEIEIEIEIKIEHESWNIKYEISNIEYGRIKRKGTKEYGKDDGKIDSDCSLL